MAGTVTVKIVGDATSLRRALGDSEAAVGGFSAKLQGVGSKMRSVGTGLAVGITAPLALMGKQAVEAASNLEQSAGAVASVFGPAGKQIEAFGKTAAQAFGLSRREVNETAAVLGAQLQSMGRSAGEAAGEVITLQERAADMAATFGGTTTEALEAISSLMRGERDPIERYGVSLKQVDINARIAADGLDTSTVAAQKQSEATAAMSILLDQTANVQGQFARESDTAAGAQARAAAQFENSKAVLGEALLPVMTQAMNVLGALAERFTNLSPTVQKVILVGAGLAAVLGPLVFIVGGLISAIGAAIPVVGAIAVAIGAVSLPVVLVGAAIVALAALIITNFDTIKRTVSVAFDFITRNGETFVRVFAAVMTGGLSEIVLLVARNWEAIKTKTGEMLDGVVEFFRGLPGRILEFGGDLLDAGVEIGGKIVKGLLDTIVEQFKKLPGLLVDAVGGMGGALAGAGKRVGSWLNPFGDAPASFSGVRIGGPAVSRVQAVLGQFPGARITSTYRDPARNRRVGGSATSLHMDARNPAVDIGGPTAVLDRMAAVLARQGGWRQLLWRVPGHFDHIHAAHRGEDITSGSPGWLPGLRPNERLRRVEVGESVVTARQKRGGGPTFNIGNVNVGNGRTFAEEMAFAEALYGQGA